MIYDNGYPKIYKPHIQTTPFGYTAPLEFVTAINVPPKYKDEDVTENINKSKDECKKEWNVSSYTKVFPFIGEIAKAKLEGKWLHIGLDYKPLYEERYDNVSDFKNGRATARLPMSQYCHIGLDGKPLYSERYNSVSQFSDYNIATAERDEIYYYIGLDGKTICECDYGDYVNDAAIASLNCMKFHIDSYIRPLYRERYDNVTNFNKHGIAIVELNEEWFYIDKKGTIIKRVDSPIINQEDFKYAKLGTLEL